MLKEVEQLQNLAVEGQAARNVVAQRENLATRIGTGSVTFGVSLDQDIRIGLIRRKVLASAKRKHTTLVSPLLLKEMRLTDDIRSKLNTLELMAEEGNIPHEIYEREKHEYESFDKEAYLLKMQEAQNNPISPKKEIPIPSSTVTVAEIKPIQEAVSSMPEEKYQADALNLEIELTETINPIAPDEETSDAAQITTAAKTRGYTKEATIDYTAKEHYVLPTGETITVTQLQLRYLSILEQKGITNIDEIASEIYPDTFSVNKSKARQKVSATVATLNNILNDKKIVIYNAGANDNDRLSKYSMQFEGNPEDAIKKTLLEESLSTQKITNFEAAMMTSHLTHISTRKEFEKRGIPIIDKDSQTKIFDAVENMGYIQTPEEIAAIRKNIIKKLNAINSDGRLEEVFQESETCVSTMILYFHSLGDKYHQAINILVNELKSRGTKTTTANGYLYHYGGAEDIIPTPAASTRWGKFLEEEEPVDTQKRESANANQQSQAEQIIESGTEIVIVDAETSLANSDLPEPQEAQTQTSAVIATEITQSPESTEDTVKKISKKEEFSAEISSYIETCMTELSKHLKFNQTIPSSVAVKHFGKLKRTYIDQIAEKNIIKPTGTNYVITYPEVVLAYVVKQVGFSRITPSTLKDIKKMIEEKIAAEQNKLNS